MASFPLIDSKVQKNIKVSKQEDTVAMFFPGPAVVRLALSSSEVLEFKPGVQAVPVKYKDHPWLKAHKVVAVNGVSVEPDKQEEQEEADREATAARLKADAAEQRSKLQSALTAMTKAELVVYGRQNYKLDLDGGAVTKPELIAAILEAADAVAAGK